MPSTGTRSASTSTATASPASADWEVTCVMATVFELPPYGQRGAAVLLSAVLRGPCDDPPPCKAVLDMLRRAPGGLASCERDFRFVGPLVVTRRAGGDVPSCCRGVLCCALDFFRHAVSGHGADPARAAYSAYLMLLGSNSTILGSPGVGEPLDVYTQLQLDLGGP